MRIVANTRAYGWVGFERANSGRGFAYMFGSCMPRGRNGLWAAWEGAAGDGFGLVVDVVGSMW